MIQVIDLFCGIGGLTRGLLDSGLNVRAGFDNDLSCQYAYSINNNVPFHCVDIRNLKGTELNNYYEQGSIKVLVGCAPCQPFSTMRFKMKEANIKDDKYDLLSEFGRIVKELSPDIISMENVPQIQRSTVFENFLSLLNELKYFVFYKVVSCPDYGISQGRRRLVLLASKLGKISLLPPTHKGDKVTVKNVIGTLPPIKSGESHKDDLLHQSANLSDKNLRRIRVSRPGGTWRDWPEELLCECHKRASGQSYGSVYGRLHWDQIGPTITTQFFSYGTGRFGHPEQDRALSLREGALLQTFPANYQFVDPEHIFSLTNIARHIGNAVPVRLGEIIGLSVKKHVEEQNNIENRNYNKEHQGG